jgi:hypothetical protein
MVSTSFGIRFESLSFDFIEAAIFVPTEDGNEARWISSK